MENIHSLSQKANDSWVKVEHAFDRIDTAAQSVDLAGQSLNAAGQKIQEMATHGITFVNKYSEAEGTFSKLFLKDDLYLRVNSILSKFETVMDDINHYGLLFSSDKGWQRLRARRLNLLQKLSTPQEFRNYFTDEVNQISTSISRVSMVLDKAATDTCCFDRMQDREFTKVFAELMRRVSMLEEEVRLYNTQVVECQVRQTELEPPQFCCPPNY
jgi:phospholipid/cholesterol/gamma-HCH transport system substrate-binding protein